MTETVNIQGLDKAEVLAALFNKARANGGGFAKFDLTPMTAEDARDIIAQQGLRLGAMQGRTLNIDLTGDTLDVLLYDSENGAGLAAKTVEETKLRTNPAYRKQRALRAAAPTKLKLSPRL